MRFFAVQFWAHLNAYGFLFDHKGSLRDGVDAKAITGFMSLGWYEEGMTEVTNGRLYGKGRRAIIAGTGSCVPKKILTNGDLEKIVDTSDEWITTRTGIKERHIIGPGETTATLATEAARRAMAAAGITADDLDLIVCATITPEMVFPSTACFVQFALGNSSCAAFDISAACSGYTYALGTGASFIASGQYDTVLVIGTETLSTLTNYQDRGSCILFGDGAGAAVLKGQSDTEKGITYSGLHADGSGWETLTCKAYGSRYPADKPLPDPNMVYMEIHGRETYQLAVRRIVDLIENSYSKCGITKEDVALIIPHQMNLRIMESVMKRLELPMEKMYVNIDRYGNTSSASIAIALDEALRGGTIKPGDLVVLVAFGAGLTWAINLIRF